MLKCLGFRVWGLLDLTLGRVHAELQEDGLHLDLCVFEMARHHHYIVFQNMGRTLARKRLRRLSPAAIQHAEHAIPSWNPETLDPQVQFCEIAG